MNKKIILILTCPLLLTSCGNPKEEPHKDGYFYLPSIITDYSGYFKAVDKEITYTYDDDGLGYKKTRIYHLDDDSKRVESYRFKEDFSGFTYNQEDYELKEETYVLESASRIEFEYLENNSYRYAKYIYEPSEEKFVFVNERCKMYNANGQFLSLTVKNKNEQIEGAYYYSMNYSYEYDEEGYVTKYSDYDFDNTPEKNSFLISYDETTYTEGHATGFTQSYYFENNEFVEDGYEQITITNENGVRKIDGQLYFQDGSEGNHNIHHYDSKFRCIYSYWGGMGQEEKIEYNDLDKITSYKMIDSSFTNEIEAEYDALGNIVAADYKMDYGTTSYNNSIVFTYNDFVQLSKVKSCYDAEDFDEHGEKVPVQYEDELTIEYTEIENKALYEKMFFIEEAISSYISYDLVVNPYYDIF